MHKYLAIKKGMNTKWIEYWMNWWRIHQVVLKRWQRMNIMSQLLKNRMNMVLTRRFDVMVIYKHIIQSSLYTFKKDPKISIYIVFWSRKWNPFPWTCSIDIKWCIQVIISCFLNYWKLYNNEQPYVPFWEK